MRILLNKLKRDNYAFFDADSKACLDLSSPGANVEKITPALRRGIIAGTIIDVDGESGIQLKPNQLKLQELMLKSMGIKTKAQAEATQAMQTDAINKLKEAQKADEEAAAKLAEEAKIAEAAKVAEETKTAAAKKANSKKKEEGEV